MLRCMTKDGTIRPLGTISPRRIQSSPHHLEFMQNIAYQWRLIAGIQESLQKRKISLQDFVLDHLDSLTYGRVRALRQMLKIDFSSTLDDFEIWLNNRDTEVQCFTFIRFFFFLRSYYFSLNIGCYSQIWNEKLNLPSVDPRREDPIHQGQRHFSNRYISPWLPFYQIFTWKTSNALLFVCPVLTAI